jgi:hypothetical protein
MDTNKAKSAESAIQLTGGEVLTSESFAKALDRSFDDRYKRKFAFPLEGEQFFKPMTQKVETLTRTGFSVPTKVVPQNRDTDDMASVQRGDGFDYSISTYVYRQMIQIEKTLEEVDDVGAAKATQEQLVNNFKYTLERAFADVFNRGIYVDSDSRTPVLAEDGCFPVDEGRPNPYASGGTWSNKEAAGTLSETLLFTASLAADQQEGEDGVLFPTEIMKMVIPPSKKLEMWKLLSTDKKLNSANNDANWANGAFSMEDVIVYKWLSSSYIYYLLANPKSEDNELFFSQRIKPGLKTWIGDNPDVVKQRLRAAWGFGLGSPRKFIRGGVLS